jgi:hypothetical protein
MRALPTEPKKAPAWRTDTMFAEILLDFFVFNDPSGFKRPNFSRKYGAVTTPPLHPITV